MDKTAIPPDRSNYGSFAILTERAQEAVHGILEAEAIKAAPAVRPPPPLKWPLPESPSDNGLLLPATKAGVLGPLRRTEPPPAPRPLDQPGTQLPRE